ncbi:hypothetical protein [Deefgea piscis]|uniref:hypothetical protein n=1 Tax=Deefgea piscis TaxID=2739061 RepID=UPI001C80DF1C|nr:hypothetical protein [Deefgea piscis]QZA80473.1 hypothetical protein K4H25_13235 [Deefgea piscis]
MQINPSFNFKALIRNDVDEQSKAKTTPIWQQEALTKISAWPESMSRSRKNAAKQRIAELKMQLDMMMKFAVVGKGNPAAAIRLAKELAAAVRAYGGGGGGDVGDVSQGLALTAGEGQGAEKAAESSVEKTTADAAAQSTAEADQLAKAVLSQVTAQASLASSKGGVCAEDQQFLHEAKALLGRIKVLIGLETKTAEDEKKARAAIREVEGALEDAPGDLAQSTETTSYTAGGEGVVDTAPSLSVSA